MAWSHDNHVKYLCRFSTAGVSSHKDNLVSLDGRDNVRGILRDGQVGLILSNLYQLLKLEMCSE